MISPHQDVDAVVPDQVDEAVLLGDPSRPDIGPEMLDRLGLSDAEEGVTHDCPNERSSRNSSWKTEKREVEVGRSDFRFLEVKLAPQIIDGLRLYGAIDRTLERAKETADILRRAEEVGRFLYGTELRCRHENHVFVMTTRDEDRLLAVLGLVEERSQVLARVAVRHDGGHGRPPEGVQESCTTPGHVNGATSFATPHQDSS